MESFPPAFHQAMQAGEGERVVRRFYTEISALAAQKDFRLFRYCLRQSPAHASARFEAGFSHRTKVRWNAELRMFEFVLTSRRKVLEDITFIR